MRFLFALFISFFAWYVQAVDTVLTWDAPTAYANGDPLPPEHIAGYQVYADVGGWMFVPGLTATIPVDPGFHCYVVQTVATNDLESVFALVCQDILGDAPPDSPVFVCP